MAKGCYESREYHRALMYLEQHMAFSNKGLSELTEGGLLAVCNVLCNMMCVYIYIYISPFYKHILPFNEICLITENLCTT